MLAFDRQKPALLLDLRPCGCDGEITSRSFPYQTTTSISLKAEQHSQIAAAVKTVFFWHLADIAAEHCF
jgi:hypothetical protein